MGTPFVDVYGRAIATFDDPNLTQVYNDNPLEFYKVMYTFFQNAIPRFNNPVSEITKLSYQNAYDGAIETFSGSGSATFTLSTNPIEDSLFSYSISGSSVSGSYSGSVTNQVVLDAIVNIGQTATIEWYYPGSFVDTLSDIEVMILGELTSLIWMEKEKNFLLDIRRLLLDSDFKLSSEANSVRSKLSWFESHREHCDKLMQQHSWNNLMRSW